MENKFHQPQACGASARVSEKLSDEPSSGNTLSHGGGVHSFSPGLAGTGSRAHPGGVTVWEPPQRPGHWTCGGHSTVPLLRLPVSVRAVDTLRPCPSDTWVGGLDEGPLTVRRNRAFQQLGGTRPWKGCPGGVGARTLHPCSRSGMSPLPLDCIPHLSFCLGSSGSAWTPPLPPSPQEPFLIVIPQ